MENLIHADIFFFVTTIVVILLGIGLVVALIYGIRILKDLKYVSRKVKEESDHVAEDIELLRAEVRTRGLALKDIGRFFGNMFKRKSSKKK